jgi:hypothetical protein
VWPVFCVLYPSLARWFRLPLRGSDEPRARRTTGQTGVEEGAIRPPGRGAAGQPEAAQGAGPWAGFVRVNGRGFGKFHTQNPPLTRIGAKRPDFRRNPTLSSAENINECRRKW